MTYEELIVAIANEAPRLSEVAYKLLWSLVSISIQQGSNEVRASHRWLAAQTGMCREGVARGARELSRLIGVDAPPGALTTFTLPVDWFSPQRPLVSAEEGPQNIHRWPKIQASGGLESRQVVANNLGQGGLESRPVVAWNLGQSCGKDTPSGLEFRPGWPGIQASSPDSPIRNAPARVDRSIDQGLSTPEHILRIDKAFHTVEILPDQTEAAEILVDAVTSYRKCFPASPRIRNTPDRIVIARCLAIAGVEELCSTLRVLLAEDRRPGISDMWFFTVFLNRIHGIPSKLINSRIDGEKKKAHAYESKPSLFPDELVNGTVRQIRKLG